MLEKQELFAEVRGAIARMNSDINRPSGKGLRNRLVESIDRSPTSISPSLPDDSRATLLTQFDALGVLRIPELTLLYHMQTRPRPVSPDPNLFFEPLKVAKSRNLRESGLSMYDISHGREKFESMAAALEGQIPSVWMMVEVTDAVLRGLRIRRFNEFHEWVKDYEGKLPDSIKQALAYGFMVFRVMEQYIHPQTNVEYANLLEEEREAMERRGTSLDLTVDKYTEDELGIS
jgi:hypothetical protein